MRYLACLLALAVTGCDSAAERAEDQYNLVAGQQFPDYNARCEQAAKVEQAYLEAGDADRYAEWDVRGRIECSVAERGEMLEEADDMYVGR